MAPKAPKVNKKRKTGSISSSPNEVSLDHEPDNRYLFRDDKAYRDFNKFLERPLSECYYFDHENKIQNMYMVKINQWINHLSLGTMISCRDTYSELTTKLFYANLRIELGTETKPTSYLYGTEIDLSITKLSEILELPSNGRRIYVHKSWPWSERSKTCTESSDQYRVWFVFGKRGKMSVTDLPALHRVPYYIVNNILTPKRSIKTNLENGALFYLKHMIAIDNIKINIPYVILSHMDKAYDNNKDSLPYGNIIHKIIRANNIDPFQVIPNLKVDKPINLLYHLGPEWKLQDNIFVPSSKDARNVYLMHPDAAPNQYRAIGAPVPEPELEPEPQSVPVQPSQTGFNENQMSFFTTHFQNLNSRFDGFETQFQGINTRLDGYDTQFQGINTRLDGYATQFSDYRNEMMSWRTGMETRYEKFENSMNSGFKEQQANGTRYHKTVNDLWVEMDKRFDSFNLGEGSKSRCDDDDEDDE